MGEDLEVRNDDLYIDGIKVGSSTIDSIEIDTSTLTMPSHKKFKGIFKPSSLELEVKAMHSPESDFKEVQNMTEDFMVDMLIDSLTATTEQQSYIATTDSNPSFEMLDNLMDALNNFDFSPSVKMDTWNNTGNFNFLDDYDSLYVGLTCPEEGKVELDWWEGLTIPETCGGGDKDMINKIDVIDTHDVLSHIEKEIDTIEIHGDIPITEIIVSPPAVVLTVDKFDGWCHNIKKYKAVAQKEKFDAEKGFAIALNKMFLDGVTMDITNTQYQKLLKLMNDFNNGYVEYKIDKIASNFK